MATVYIDVREPFEYKGGHVEGAVNKPLTKLLANTAKQLQDVSKKDKLVVYCRSGTRSEMAKKIITAQGYTSVVNGISQKTIESGK